jgi:glutamyl-tRNA synthetase
MNKQIPETRNCSTGPIRVRFAPSPTGYLHVGGARVALFNYLLAKKMGGTFILRIEDTDRERSTQAAVDAILEGMEWLGLTWDEGPFYQTQRVDLYKKMIQKLLDEKKAYPCYCTPEELEVMRANLLAAGKKPKYDGRCKSKPFDASKPHTVRFEIPKGTTTIHDLVKGDIVIENEEIEDLIIARTDGFPTYNFTAVVDDMDMQITHVIRGDDHVNNTPKQILMGQALGYTIPKFAHLPMILGEDKQKLSKRHGATSVIVYKDMGFFPHALLNFLVRLGWSYKDQEIFSMEEMIEKFDIENVGSSAGVFNTEKLLWLNQHYMKTKPYEEVLSGVEHFVKIPESKKKDPHLKDTIDALRDRAKTLDEMAKMAMFYIDDNFEASKDDIIKHVPKTMVEPLKMFASELNSLATFNHDTIGENFQKSIGRNKPENERFGTIPSNYSDRSGIQPRNVQSCGNTW